MCKTLKTRNNENFSSLYLFLTPPSPQLLEHSPHSRHSFHWQSLGQHCSLHLSDLYDAPKHSLPPHTASWVTYRDDVMTPPPHVTSHWVNSLHGDQRQSLGQQPVLHCRVSSNGASHSEPPQSASISWTRIRVLVPPSQEALHSPELFENKNKVKNSYMKERNENVKKEL